MKHNGIYWDTTCATTGKECPARQALVKSYDIALDSDNPNEYHSDVKKLNLRLVEQSLHAKDCPGPTEDSQCPTRERMNEMSGRTLVATLFRTVYNLLKKK